MRTVADSPKTKSQPEPQPVPRPPLPPVKAQTQPPAEAQEELEKHWFVIHTQTGQEMKVKMKSQILMNPARMATPAMRSLERANNGRRKFNFVYFKSERKFHNSITTYVKSSVVISGIQRRIRNSLTGL